MEKKYNLINSFIKEIEYSILYWVCEDICRTIFFRIQTGKKFQICIRIRIHSTAKKVQIWPDPDQQYLKNNHRLTVSE
jgi:hypothetical protein